MMSKGGTKSQVEEQKEDKVNEQTIIAEKPLIGDDKTLGDKEENKEEDPKKEGWELQKFLKPTTSQPMIVNLHAGWNYKITQQAETESSKCELLTNSLPATGIVTTQNAYREIDVYYKCTKGSPDIQNEIKKTGISDLLQSKSVKTWDLIYLLIVAVSLTTVFFILALYCHHRRKSQQGNKWRKRLQDVHSFYNEQTDSEIAH